MLHRMYRSSDPETSKEGAKSVAVESQKGKALRLLKKHPGHTAAEYDRYNGTPQGTIRKRLNDLAIDGLAFCRGTKKCSVSDRKAQIWYPEAT